VETPGIGVVVMADIPIPNVNGWVCFHCGEAFTDANAARDHFGFDPSDDPACRIKLGGERSLITALRKAERACANMAFAMANESTDAAQAYWDMVTRHNAALEAAENLGYERGLRDGRAA